MYGLPNAIVCVECIFFSAAFWYAFSSSEYAEKPSTHHIPLWRAIPHALNPYDLVCGVARAVGLLSGCFGNRSRSYDDMHAPAPITRADRGRYRTLDNMESLAVPDRSRSRTPLQGEGSPPRYEFKGSQEHLAVGVRQERSLSPGLDRQYGAVGEGGMV